MTLQEKIQDVQRRIGEQYEISKTGGTVDSQKYAKYELADLMDELRDRRILEIEQLSQQNEKPVEELSDHARLLKHHQEREEKQRAAEAAEPKKSVLRTPEPHERYPRPVTA